MEQIEIIGYTIVNGTSHHTPPPFKHCFVNSLDEIIPFKEKVRRRWEKKLGSECEVYPVLKHKEEIYSFLKEKKERKHELYTRRTDNSKN